MIVKRGKKWTPVIYDRKTGKKVWLKPCDTKTEARDLEAATLLELKQSKVREEATCDGFARTWVERFPRPKRSTNEHNAERIKRFIEDFQGRPLNKVTRAEARDWALEHRSNVPVVRAMFNDARSDELVDSNPFENLRLQQSRGRKDLIVPTDDEVTRLIEAAREVHGLYGRDVYANLIQFAAYTGLRQGELFGLWHDDLDLNAGVVRVSRQWNIKIREYTTPKSGKGRTVHLSRQAREAYERVPKSDRREVFLTPNGKLFAGGSVTYWWHPVRAAAGMAHQDFHSLRHYYGTWLARNNVPPVALKEMMGHADLATTMVYIHMTEQDAVAQVAAALGAAGPAGVVREIRRTA